MDTAEPTPFEPIACERLDKENAAWVRQYVDKWQARLEAEGDDPELAAYARREIAAYQDLLGRFAVVAIAGLALLVALGRPALALKQSGEHPESRPALLADRLRLASEDIGQARAMGQELGGRPVHLMTDVPRWTRERLLAADCLLRRASFDTADPVQQREIARFRATIRTLGPRLDRHRLTLWPQIAELEGAVQAMASRVQARVSQRVQDLAPIHRPPLGQAARAEWKGSPN